MDNILEIKNLSAHFLVGDSVVKAVDGVSLSIKRNETLALIGESGSGKSVLGLAVLRLLPENVRLEGEILFNGINLPELTEKEIRKIRGRHIAWIPQNPATAMNPGMRVGVQIAEPMILHLGLKKDQALKKSVSLLNSFGIEPAGLRAKEYPYQYSGGMLERALVAMGTSAAPELVIADEPTKGVDSIKKQSITALFRKIKRENVSVMLITHDLHFAKAMADRIAVNYCGQIMEVCDAEQFFREPYHPYSRALLKSLPSGGLKPISGDSPGMTDPPRGCRFYPRCEYATARCLTEPQMKLHDGNLVRCRLYD